MRCHASPGLMILRQQAALGTATAGTYDVLDSRVLMRAQGVNALRDIAYLLENERVKSRRRSVGTSVLRAGANQRPYCTPCI